MRICYNKLQKLMIDNQMKRQDLMRAADISSYTATKINKNEPVSLEVLMKICQVFHCDIGDICEVILDEIKKSGFYWDGIGAVYMFNYGNANEATKKKQ